MYWSIYQYTYRAFFLTAPAPEGRGASASMGRAAAVRPRPGRKGPEECT